jgi:hypothetical protein
VIHAFLKCTTCRWLPAELSTTWWIPVGYKKVIRAVVDGGDLGCEVMYSGRSLLTLRRNVLTPSLGSKSRRSKQAGSGVLPCLSLAWLTLHFYQTTWCHVPEGSTLFTVFIIIFFGVFFMATNTSPGEFLLAYSNAYLHLRRARMKYIVAYARTAESQKQPLLSDTLTQHYNNGGMQPGSRQRLGKHISASRTVLCNAVTSPTIRTVFAVGSVQGVYKRSGFTS